MHVFSFSRFFDVMPMLFHNCTRFLLSFSLVHDESQKHFKHAFFVKTVMNLMVFKYEHEGHLIFNIDDVK